MDSFGKGNDPNCAAGQPMLPMTAPQAGVAFIGLRTVGTTNQQFVPAEDFQLCEKRKLKIALHEANRQPDPTQKAALIAHAIASEPQAFYDGNKRTAAALACQIAGITDSPAHRQLLEHVASAPDESDQQLVEKLAEFYRQQTTVSGAA